MPETQGVLNAAAQAVVDGTGTARVTIGPKAERWEVNSMSVNTSSATSTPVCRVYLGLPVYANTVEGTEVGSGDTSNTVYRLLDGQFLTIEWTGADVGATAYVTLSGRKWIYGSGFVAVQ